MGKLTHAAERQERTETKCSGRMTVNQRIADQDSIFIMLENYLFLEDHTTHTVKCSRHLIAIKLTNVLVAQRTEVVALVLMQTKIEFSTMLNHRNIQRTQENMVVVVQFRNRYNQKSVVLTDITVHYR